MGSDHLWEAISAIGQAMSALALFGVFIQLSHARAEARRSVLDAMSNSVIAVQAMSLDPRYLSASTKAHAALGGDRHPFVSALMNGAALTEEEANLLLIREGANWHSMAQAIRNVDSLKSDDLTALEVNLNRLYAKSPVGRLWYQCAKGGVVANPRVMRYVDKVLAHSR
jgi:hypothetical protein